ncbi:MAG TPA: hypothetical protein ENK18_20115 [Deltaproteobacteria bacterium]|nr:hypothetical protein [Deltaproteobacteria bacterium]
MDEFSSPAPEAARPPQGTLELGRAISEGVGAALANFLQIVVVNLLFVLTLYLSCCTCVGFFVAAPVLMWGFYAFILQAIDGRGQIGTLFVGFEHLSVAFFRMLGVSLCLFLIYSPIVLVVVGLMWPDLERIAQGQQPDPVMQALKTGVPMLLWSLVTVRVFIAPYFMVERDLGPLEALQASWEVTAHHWGALVALLLLLNLLTLPGQVLSIGAQLYAQQGSSLGPDPVSILLQLGGFAITMFASTLGLMFFASAYRQLTGPAPEGALGSVAPGP